MGTSMKTKEKVYRSENIRITAKRCRKHEDLITKNTNLRVP